MSDALVSLLSDALDRRGALYQSIADKHKHRDPETASSWILHELAEHIGPTVKKESHFNAAPNLMIRRGNGASSFTYMAPRILLKWAGKRGAKWAVDRFKKLLTLKEAVGFHVEIVSGFPLERRLCLTAQIVAIPFDRLSVAQKERMTRLGVEVPNIAMFHEPSAALMIRSTIKPLFCSIDQLPGVDSYFDPYPIFGAARQCLGLVGPRPLTRLNGWFQFENKTINEISGAGASSSPALSVPTNFHLPPARNYTQRKMVSLVGAHSRLRDGVKEKVDRALDRMNSAMCRPLPGDAAIDLAIAFEALTTDPHTRGEHGYKVGLRSALLAAQDFDSRQEIRQLVAEIYDYRSQVMHQGHVSKKKQKRAAEDVKLGVLRCAEIIEKVMRAGRLPKDWSRFELSGGIDS